VFAALVYFGVFVISISFHSQFIKKMGATLLYMVCNNLPREKKKQPKSREAA